MLPELKDCTIAIIGLGYVGLPIAVQFSKKQPSKRGNYFLNRKVIGYDINKNRIDQLKNKIDITGEICKDSIINLNNISLTNDKSLISNADIFIVTVPTPIDSNKNPDLECLKFASEDVGEAIALRSKHTKTTPVVIFESTVFPGVTEDICVPIIRKSIKLNSKGNPNIENFAYGYSPERINPGDKKHKLEKVIKVTSGNTEESSIWIDNLYGSIIDAGTFRAKSIKVAEAAKVIENTQRDLNIALVNEFAIIFRNLNIDTLDILETASTKWNFLNFKPGLVGGHCIGVDPYYLTNKSIKEGYYPELVLAGRRINDNMSNYIVKELIFEMSKRGLSIEGKNILILGLTFKSNCPDIRNSQVIKIIDQLSQFNISIEVFDPVANLEEVKRIHDLEVKNNLSSNELYDVVIAAVAHDQFKVITTEKWKNFIKNNSIFFDLKGIIPRELNPIRL